MDQEKIERALDACYEAVAAPDTWQPALDAMSAAMGAAAIMQPDRMESDPGFRSVLCRKARDFRHPPNGSCGGGIAGPGWPLQQLEGEETAMNGRSTAVRIAALLAVSALLAGTAAAGGLPKGARKLSTAQVKALYSGHTGVWSKSKEYFVPDGTVRHVKNDGTLYGVGKWHARGNTVCADLTWHSLKDGSSGKTRDCWSWARKRRDVLHRLEGQRRVVERLVHERGRQAPQGRPGDAAVEEGQGESRIMSKRPSGRRSPAASGGCLPGGAEGPASGPGRLECGVAGNPDSGTVRGPLPRRILTGPAFLATPIWGMPDNRAPSALQAFAFQLAGRALVGAEVACFHVGVACAESLL